MKVKWRFVISRPFHSTIRSALLCSVPDCSIFHSEMQKRKGGEAGNYKWLANQQQWNCDKTQQRTCVKQTVSGRQGEAQKAGVGYRKNDSQGRKH